MKIIFRMIEDQLLKYKEAYTSPRIWFITLIVTLVAMVIATVCSAQVPQTFYVAIDSTTNSQMLKRELECTNWQARINPVVLQSLNPSQRSSFNEFALRMDQSKKRISELWTVVYVNYHDLGSPTGTYPKYRIGKYREWHTFNSQAFSEVSYPLRTVEYLYEQWYYMDFVDIALKKNEDEVNTYLKKKNDIYHKWLFKSKEVISQLFIDKEFYEPYTQELKDNKLTPEYFPKVPHFEEPLKLPYE